MPADFESGGAGRDERAIGGWRAIGAAWALTLAMTLVLAGVSTIAAGHEGARQPATLAQIVIPQHDPGCTGTDIAGPHPAACSDAPLPAEPMAGAL